MFDLLENTEMIINGEKHLLRFENGMTGIGSRRGFIDNREFSDNFVRHSADLTKGNHFLYRMRWRDNPWSYVYILIAEEFEADLLSEENKWRDIKKIELSKN